MKDFLHKIFIVAFMLYYIVIASGVNIKLHYCEGEISDFAVNTNSISCDMHHEDPCESDVCVSHIADEHINCEFDNPHQCCSNQEVYIALKSLLNFSSKNFKIQNPELEIINNFNIEEISKDNITDIIITHNYIDNSYPPPYVAFQQLLVYS